jgi:FAD/FMN-containing dehydrogenase
LYANERNIPYLAKVGGHGAIDSLGDVHNGIQISMRQLNHVRISEDGDVAIIGGGVNVKEVVDALWSAGKQTGMVNANPLES